MMSRGKGRPPTRPIQLRDGFYIEVRNRGSNERGVKIHCETKENMESAIKQYERSNKEVTVLGEHKDFEWESGKSNPKKPRKEPAARKVEA